MLRWWLIYWLAVCVPLRNCLADETPPARPAPCPLALADLENLALVSNPTIAAAEALVRQEQGLWRQVGLYPNPSVGYIRSDPDQSGESRTQGVFLSQDIVTGGKLRLSRAAESQEIELRRWQLHAQRERVLNDVRIRYYEALGAQRLVAAARDLERLAAEGLAATEELRKSGHGTRPDVLQAELQLQAIRLTRQDTEYRYEAAWRHLANVVGNLGLTPVPLAGNLEDGIPQLDWQQSLDQLLAASPVLRAQEAQVRASRFEARRARVEPIPNVTVQVVAQRDAVQKFSSVSTFLAVPVPVFNRNQGNIVNADARLVQQQKELERAQLALADQLAASFRQYRSAANQAARLREEILPRARENLDLSMRAYRLGQFDFLRVLNARQTYFQMELAYVEALAELHKVVIEIAGLQLTGALNPTEIGTALQAQPGAGAAGARNVLLNQLQEQGPGSLRSLPGPVQAGER